jgi:hypothetical protein
MRENEVGAITIKSLALLVVLATPYRGMAQDATTPYPKMAPIERYLMDRTEEITLAQSAAPDSISRDATILILGRQGYETAVQGKTVSSAWWDGGGEQHSTGTNSGTRR